MIPGINARPPASMVCFPERFFPISLIFPSRTARSLVKGAEPRPSSKTALRMTRSSIPGQYTCRPMFDLKGKTAIVTGGAKGIGAATVKLFEKAGAKVHVLDIVNGGVDVTDAVAVKAAFASIGEIDILVNNAGRTARKPAVDLSE